ncbi:hypothetical protein CISIN_1g030547mg [Citrus sinensis]|uniref:Transcription factor CBF/NF-Y/archaeal histone domain-containing protein n=1 Tax=Citrus sinensis TaxID=2711 RepID=A0A067DNX7_CITSI|nr:hypothetical protein CISIN_1g030547mg [Citrus sinensis]
MARSLRMLRILYRNVSLSSSASLPASFSFLSCRASDKCQKEKRKTINGDDLLWAMATLGFEDYIDPLKAYLMRYREMEGDTKGSARGGDGSAKRDTIGALPGQNAQYALQGPLNYANPHVTFSLLHLISFLLTN